MRYADLTRFLGVKVEIYQLSTLPTSSLRTSSPTSNGPLAPSGSFTWLFWAIRKRRGMASMKALMGTWKERSNNQRHMLGTKISPIQGFNASYFHLWHRNLGRWLEKLSLESPLRRALRCISWRLTSKCILQLPIISYWLNTEDLPKNYTLSSLLWSFNNTLPTYPPSWLVNKVASISQHLANQGFNIWYSSTTIWKTSWGLSHWGTHDNPTTSKTTYVDIEFFLAKEWNSFHLFGKKLDYLHLKDFLQYKCELYLKQPLTPPQHKIIADYRTSNHRLEIETRQWTMYPYL